ncbi:hypothetical protein Cni_G23893 [Canna indica]|uniref:Cysteine-rich receptor-like protein kinase 10 n=1 Tax=Canna indica TaxID=4628 RepID=A0AAQ3KX16_9LILI|nr:hypothetical protein Cni_G23893 [Canna indica]
MLERDDGDEERGLLQPCSDLERCLVDARWCGGGERRSTVKSLSRKRWSDEMGRGVAFRWKICNQNAGNFNENSTYQSNLNLLLSSLVSNGSRSSFFTDTVGQIPNQVYGLVLCRGDANATKCSSWLRQVSVDILQLCVYNKDAIVWDDECVIHYSNTQFLNTFDNQPEASLYAVADVDQAGRFNKLVNELLNKTADWAAYNSTKRFATGQVFNATPNFPIIYGLAQCTPDMPARDCRQCLEESSHGLVMSRPGARNLGVRCNIRFENYSFYLGSPDIKIVAPSENSTTPSNNATAPVDAPIFQPSLPPAVKRGKKNVTGIVLAIGIPAVFAILLIPFFCICCLRKRKSAPDCEIESEKISSVESILFDLSTLRTATANFCEENKLGEGGFGAVYKGLLPNGREVAVKRLLNSGQGLDELKNELVLVAKLQHRNLVKNFGVCLEEEKMIVYEYVPNRSLDTFLFDPVRGGELNWGTRYKIVNGIARGILYLHEESQLKIIHRDLKASNILLDADMNPKISDFGLAKLFDCDQSQCITNRIVGTYGYMAPEYAVYGKFSVKSDVFSFGVLVLEILTGRKNSGSCDLEYSEDLLGYTWQNWNRGTALEIVDPVLDGHYQGSNVLRCIQIGLLCVQENPADRPTMRMVDLMLNSETVSLQPPSRPAFCVENTGMRETTSSSNISSFQVGGTHETRNKSFPASPNEVSISELEPR